MWHCHQYMCTDDKSSAKTYWLRPWIARLYTTAINIVKFTSPKKLRNAEVLQDISLTDLNQILWNDRPSVKDQWIRFRHWSGLDTWSFFHFSNTERERFYKLIVIGLLKKLWMNVHEIFGRVWGPSDKEHLIRFWDWSWSGSGSGSIFLLFHHWG